MDARGASRRPTLSASNSDPRGEARLPHVEQQLDLGRFRVDRAEINDDGAAGARAADLVVLRVVKLRPFAFQAEISGARLDVSFEYRGAALGVQFRVVSTNLQERVLRGPPSAGHRGPRGEQQQQRQSAGYGGSGESDVHAAGIPRPRRRAASIPTARSRRRRASSPPRRRDPEVRLGLATSPRAVHRMAIDVEKFSARRVGFYDCATMSALHVVVRPLPDNAPEPALAALHGLFDVVVDGINVTARIGEGQAVTLLAELGQLTAQLGRGVRQRGSVQLYASDSVWEVAVERDGSDALLTVFRGGPNPEIVAHEKRVAFSALVDGVRVATQDLLRRPRGAVQRGEAPRRARAIPAPVRHALRAVLDDLTPEGVVAAPARALTLAEMRSESSDRYAVRARAQVRLGLARPDASHTALERADLHALLRAGEVKLTLGAVTLTTSNVQVFLAAERLVQLGRDVLLTARGSRALLRRTRLGTLKLEVRRGPGQQHLELRAESTGTAGLRVASSQLGWAEFVQAQADFAVSVRNAFVSADPAQRSNLRLRELGDAAEAIRQEMLSVSEDDSVTNPMPEGYRAFSPRQRRVRRSSDGSNARPMRFAPQWVATIPGIDLRSTFLCGERLIVGSNEEIACLERSDGAIRWRTPAPLAGSLVAPTGLLRIQPDGTLTSHDLDDGQIRFTVRTSPRTGGGAAGSIVFAPGLPKLFAFTESDRQVSAIDLVTGELRWRHCCKRPGTYRIRRSGKLLLISGGDSALEALDVTSGEIVWRARGQLPYTGDIGLEHHAAFALAGCSGAGWELQHLDVCTGERLWTATLDERPMLGRAPLVTPNTVIVPTAEGEEGGAYGFDRATGERIWEHEPGLVAGATAWLAVDDFVVANSASGVLLAIDAQTGGLRFNHVFSRERASDQPRRLEPVLRSGALFVPQSTVHVVRPHDGEIIGHVRTDLVPDLIRVDERCSVYIAEESGHLAAFTTAPRLTLVKS